MPPRRRGARILLPRLYLAPRPELTLSVDDDAVTRRDAFADNRALTLLRFDFNRAHRDGIVVIDDVHDDPWGPRCTATAGTTSTPLRFVKSMRALTNWLGHSEPWGLGNVALSRTVAVALLT